MNLFVLGLMIAVIIAESREYNAWRSANSITRGLYVAREDQQFYIRLPNFDFFWEFVGYVLSGQFVW